MISWRDEARDVGDRQALVGSRMLLYLGIRLTIEETKIHLLRLVGFIGNSVDANYAGSSP